MLKIKKHKLISTILLLAIFESTYVNMLFAPIHYLCLALKMLILCFSSIGIISCYPSLEKQKKQAILLYMAYYAYLLINTAIQGQGVNIVISDLSACMYFLYICIDTKKRLFDYFGSIYIALTIYIVINWITMIIYPNGIWNIGYIGAYWLLGMDNMFIYYIYPLLLVSAILLVRKFRLIYLFPVAVSVVTLVSRWAVTSMLGVFVFLLLVLLPLKMKEKIRPEYAFIAAIFIFIMLINAYSSDLIRHIVVDIFHKDMTFSSRTLIWEKALKFINEKPLFGYGRLSSESFQDMLIYGSHPHNLYLYHLMVNGCIGTFIYILLSFMAFKKLKTEIPKKYAAIISASLIGLYVMGITESTTRVFYELPLILALVTSKDSWIYDNKIR